MIAGESEFPTLSVDMVVISLAHWVGVFNSSDAVASRRNSTRAINIQLRRFAVELAVILGPHGLMFLVPGPIGAPYQRACPPPLIQ